MQFDKFEPDYMPDQESRRPNYQNVDQLKRKINKHQKHGLTPALFSRLTKDKHEPDSAYLYTSAMAQKPDLLPLHKSAIAQKNNTQRNLRK